MNYFKNTKILVLGGLGFIGSKLVRVIHPQTTKITIVDFADINKAPYTEIYSEFNKLGIQVINKNIGDFNLNEYYDSCYVLASLNDQTSSSNLSEKYINENIVNLDVFLRNNISKIGRVILTSSRAVYGSSTSKSKEDDNLNPINIYGFTKASQEYLVRIHSMREGIPFKIFRLFNVWGEDQSLFAHGYGLVSQIINKFKSQKRVEIYNSGRIIRDFIHVDDVVTSIYKLSNELNNNISNIGTGIETNLFELAQDIKQKLPDKLDLVSIDKPENISYSVANTNILRQYIDIDKFKNIKNLDPLKFI